MKSFQPGDVIDLSCQLEIDHGTSTQSSELMFALLICERPSVSRRTSAWMALVDGRTLRVIEVFDNDVIINR